MEERSRCVESSGGDVESPGLLRGCSTIFGVSSGRPVIHLIRILGTEYSPIIGSSFRLGHVFKFPTMFYALRALINVHR